MGKKKNKSPLMSKEALLGLARLQNVEKTIRSNAEVQADPYRRYGVDTENYQVDRSGMQTDLSYYTSPSDVEEGIEKPEERGILDKMYDTVSGVVGGIGDALHDVVFGTDDTSFKDKWNAGGISDSYNLLQKKRLSTDLTSQVEALRNTKLDIDDLDMLTKEYIPTLERLQQVNESVKWCAKHNVPQNDKYVMSLLNEQARLQKWINAKNEYIKTDGKYSDALRSLFFDVKNRNNMSLYERLKSYKDVAAAQYFNTGGVKDDWSSVLGAIKSGTLQGLNWLSNAVTAVADDVSTLLPGGITHNQNVGNAIKNTSRDDRTFDNLFTNYGSDGKNSASIQSLKDKISMIKPEYQRAYKEQKAIVNSTKRKLTNGTWWFDPKAISKDFEKIQQKDRGIVGAFLPWNLKYSLPELGSSWSDVEDFGAMMLTDAAMKKVVVPLLVAAATKNPEAGAWASSALTATEAAATTSRFKRALNTLKESKALVSEAAASGDMIKGVINSSRFAKTAEGVNAAAKASSAMMVGGAAETAANVYFTNALRRNESRSEAMDAYSSRVIDQAMKKGINMNSVMDQIDSFARSIGEDWSDLDENQKIQMALGYNVKTNNPEFEKLKKDARKGLNKLYNDNMGLAAMDYWESIPMLGYFGSFAKSLGKGFKAGRMYNASSLYGDAIKGSEDAVELAMQRTANAMIDKKIDGMAAKIFKNPGRLMQYNTGKKYVTDRLKRLASLGAKEGTEEGQQQLLQQRYQRGEYDNYDGTRSLFGIPNAVEDLDLGVQAIGDYLGINYTDPDNASEELRKAMNIGFATSLFFPASGAVTNLFKTQDDNLRNTLAQMRNDNVVRKLVAQNYGNKQDQDHVGTFFDAFSKAGVNFQRLQSSLNNLKNYTSKLNGVTDAYIDNDIKLLGDTWSLYKSKHMEEAMKDLNIKKNSAQHRTLVQNGVKAIRDFSDIFIKQAEQTNQIDSQTEDLINNAIEGKFDNNPELEQVVSNILKKHTNDKNIREAISEALRTKWIKDNTTLVDDVELSEEQNTELNRIYNEEGAQAAKDYKQGLIDDVNNANRKEAEGKWNAHKADVISKAKETLANEKATEDQKIAAENTLNAYQDYEITEEDAIRGILNIIQNQHYIENLKKVRDSIVKDRLKFNEALRSELGTDINTDNLRSVLDILNRRIIKASKKYSKKQLEAIKEYGDLSYSEDFDNLQKSQILNQAVAERLLPIAQVYNPDIIPNKRFMPNEGMMNYRGLMWSDLTDSEKQQYINQARQDALDAGKREPTIKEIINKYRKEQKAKRAQYTKIRNQFRDKLKYNEEAGDQLKPTDALDLETIRKQAMEQIMRTQLMDSENRQYIANKIEEEERPLTGADIDDAEDGVKEAQDKVEIESKKQDEEDAQSIIESMHAQPNTVDDEGELAEDTIEGYSEDEADVEAIIDQGNENIQEINDIMSGDNASERRRQRELQSRVKASIEEAQHQAEVSDDKVEQDENPKPKERIKAPKVEAPELPKDKTDTATVPTVDNNEVPADTDVINAENGQTVAVTKDGDNIVIDKQVDDETGDVTITATSAENKEDNSEHKPSDENPIKIPVEALDGFTYDGEEDVEEDLKHIVKVTHNPSDVNHVTVTTQSGKKIQLTKDGTVTTEREGDEAENNSVDPDTNQDKHEAPEKDQVEEELGGEPLDETLNENEESNHEDLSGDNDSMNVETESSNLELYDNDGDTLNVDTDIPAGMDFDVSKLSIEYAGDEQLILYDGKPLSNEDYIDEQQLLDAYESGMVDSSQEYEQGFTMNKQDVLNKNVITRDYIGSTFFYSPTDDSSFHNRKVNGKELKFKYKVKSGKELSEKLTQKGWFENLNKNGNVYYVVSGDTNVKSEDIRDNLTVNLVIDDPESKSTYITVMRTPGKYSYEAEVDGKVQTFYVEKGIDDIIKKLRLVGVDTNLYEENLIKQIGISYQAKGQHIDDPMPTPENKSEDEYFKEMRQWRSRVYDWFTQLKQTDPDEFYKIDYRTRVASRKNGVNKSDIFDQAAIERQVKNLKDTRNQIINAYCMKDSKGNLIIPDTIRTDIKPKTASISNGKFKTNRDPDTDLPTFRSIVGEEGGFGLSSDIEELDKQLKDCGDGSIFGYGLGAFAEAGSKFNIRGIFNATDQYQSKGLAGKIYYFISSKLMPGTNVKGTKIPLMLREETFKTQEREDGTHVKLQRPSDVVLMLDPVTGDIVNSENSNRKPSSAEIILYLLCNRLNSRFIPNFTPELAQIFCDIFVNNGASTLITERKYDQNGNDTRSIEQILSSKLSYYCSKQLAYVDKEDGKGYRLYVGTDDGRLVIRPIDLFPSDTATEDQKRKAAELRQRVVFLISKNMHWNTSIADMTEGIDPRLRRSLRQYFDDNPEAKTFYLCGNSQLSFNKDDLFKTDEDGNITGNKNVSLMALMLKNGRLKTDVNSKVFEAPFVFANGVKQTTKDKTIHIIEKNQAKPEDGNPAPSIVEAKGKTQAKAEIARESVGKFDEKAVEAVRNKVKKSERKKFETLLKKTEEQVKIVLDSFSSNQVAKDNGGLKDILALNTEKKTIKTVEDVRQVLTEQLNRYSEYLKQNGQDPLDLSKVNFNENQFLSKKIKFNRGGIIPIAYVYNNGTVGVFPRSAEEINSALSGAGITGVFSKFKHKGKIDEHESRKWISETLGLSDENVIVVSAIMRGCNNEAVYGMMNIATDSITGALNPYIMLSKAEGAGRGLHFHEAWHYVNLLIHNKAVRRKIYDEYVVKHPGLKNSTYAEIEEYMAEDFRRYAEMKEGYGLTNRIKRFFNNIIDFLIQSRKKSQIRRIYNGILSGEYKGVALDKESLQEFQKAYDKQYGAEFTVPGVDQKYIDNFKGITSYQQFYRIGNALAYKLINDYALTTPEQIKHATADQYQSLIEDLKSEIACGNDPQRAVILQDIIDNQPAFKKIIQTVFKQYNIEVDADALMDEAQAKDTGDMSVYEHTKDSMKISKKDNVALRAKLFLTQIQKAKFEYDETDLESGKQLLYAQDDILGWPEYFTFSEAWNNILDNLWSCDSFNQKDKNNEYMNTSIMGRVHELAKSTAFFAVLENKLEDEVEGDVELQNQIFATIVSHKPQVAFFELRDRRVYLSKEDLEAQREMAERDGVDFTQKGRNSVADRNRDWILYDDNTLRAKRNLPRKWSKAFALSAIIKNGVVDRTAVTKLDNIIKDIDKVFNDKNLSVPEKVFSIKEGLLNALQMMGIPFDEEVLDRYISMNMKKTDNSDDFKDQLNAIGIILGESKVGNLKHFVAMLTKSIGKDKLNISRKDGGSKDGKELDQLFSGYKLDTQITMMAQAFNDIHPSSSEFSVQGPDGSTIYPMSQNNYISDRVRHLNELYQQDIQDLYKSPYCKNSQLLKIVQDYEGSEEVLTGDDMFKLCVFVGLRDERTKDGNDYFGINPMEDYIAKMQMTFSDLMVSPTMADKKTWYGIMNKNLHLIHDIMTWSKPSKSGQFGVRRFSDNTLSIFRGYYTDELRSLMQYYNRETVAYVVSHPNEVRKNYHGKVKNGKMDFSGNGGKFRYFYDTYLFATDEVEVDGKIQDGPVLNMNQYLQFLYEKQQQMMKDGVTRAEILKRGDSQDKQSTNELDGFELIRGFLEGLNETLKTDRKSVEDLINDMLMGVVDRELENLSQSDGIYQPIKILQKNGDGSYSSTGIPKKILEFYAKKFSKTDYVKRDTKYTNEDGTESVKTVTDKIKPYSKGDSHLNDLTLSAVASHVASYMMSVIETEKIITGDPAWYKWKYSKQGTEVTITDKETNEPYTVTVDNLFDKHADKIKRLGSVLSPGENIRAQYGDDILEQHPDLNRSTYTFANVGDITGTLEDDVLDNVTQRFKLQAAVNIISIKPECYFGEGLSSDEYKQKQSKLFKRWYSNYKNFIADYEAWDDKQKVKPGIEKEASNAASSYSNITVSDAQVCIRPWMYRLLRIAMGEWTFEEDDNGYSDEKAYNIVEGIGEYADKKGKWQDDLELSMLVNKFQLKPLKMTYFANESKVESKAGFFNMPVYNKMAIFPMFEYACASETGSQLYKRMNKPGNEIDMLGFDSSVKVGCNKNMWTPFNDGDEPTSDYSKFNNINDMVSFVDSESDNYIDENGENHSRVNEKSSVDDINNLLPVQIQYVDRLRLQLNTDAHEADQRAIGTQMFKIAFSNIFDNEDYGLGKTGDNITGRNLKNDIMACINALTKLGVNDIQKKFFNKDNSLNDEAVAKLVQTIVQNNGLGSSAEEIIQNGGVVASLMSRTLFEQSVSKKVNKAVVDINTNGGSAVQQSIFGFVGNNLNNGENTTDQKSFDFENLSNQGYHVPNGGRKLKWLKKDNSMEVMLGMNFFRPVLEGVKCDENGNITEDGKYNLWNRGTYNSQRAWLLEHNMIGAKTKPFGIGYRIPTQGMSSMFAFCVADVLPCVAGDTIIVPDAFTAQTGSDFDVDKLFLATFSYKNGVKEHIDAKVLNYDEDVTYKDKNGEEISKTIHKTKYFANQAQFDAFNTKIKEKLDSGQIHDVTVTESADIENNSSITSRTRQIIYENASKGAIGNKLLEDYMKVITDNRNFKQSRGSIDTITDYITKVIVPMISQKTAGYKEGMYDASPSFQERTKMEFSTGKDGIGPFALNITNMALTQYAHLTFDYGDNLFELGDLDNPLSQDGSYVADWLSAMVNAHVDVAKDPYIFTINVNKATYKITNFLIRAGKGAGTFTFLAQPSLKKYANMINSAGGMYGGNLDGSNLGTKSRNDIFKEQFKQAKDSTLAAFHALKSKDLSKEQAALYNKYNTWVKILTGDLKASDMPEESKELFRQVFDIEKGAYAIQHPKTFYGKFFQLLTLYTFDKLSRYADEMSDLVKNSRIDTKKFGNSVATQMDYMNKYNAFRFAKDRGSKPRWVINKNGKKVGASKENPNYALDMYFNTTYLDNKLQNAVHLTKAILSGQTYTATSEYEQLFNDIMRRKYGEKQLIKTFMNQKNEVQQVEATGYNPKASDDVVKGLSQSMDDIIRYRVFKQFGQTILARYESDEENAKGPIDFFSSNPADEQRRLLFGLPIEKGKEPSYLNYSIYDRIQALINRADEFGLEDNELLKFITPVAPTNKSKFNIPKLLLKSSQMDIAEQEKQLLTSAFEQLLSHEDLSVRRLARDIARFAYFSTYDQNTVNSFFDLVPTQYRVQYDQALAYGLKNPGSTFDAICGSGANYIYGVIARNYWFDDSIVDIYNGQEKASNTIIAGIENRYKIFRQNGQLVYGIMFIKAQNANAEYIKMQKGDTTYLYRKAGVIKTTYKNDNGKKQTVNKNVYVIIPKAGLHDGKNHYYEFFIDDKNHSLFSDNALPETLMYNDHDDYKGLGTYIKELVKDPDVQATKKQREMYSDIQCEFVENYDFEFSGTYYRVQTEVEDTNLHNSDNTVEFVPTDDPKQMVNTLSDCNINIEEGDDEKAVVKKITDAVSDNNTTNPKSLSIVDNRQDVEPTDEEIAEYVISQVNAFRKELTNNDSVQDIEDQVSEYKDQVSATAIDDIKQQKEDDFIFSIMQEAIAQGVKLNKTYTTNDRAGIALAKATRLLFSDIQDGSMMLFDKNMKEEDLYPVISQLSGNNNRVDSEEETDTKENMSEIVQSSEDFEESLKQEDKDVSDNISSDDSELSINSTDNDTAEALEQTYSLEDLMIEDDALVKESKKPTEQSEDKDEQSEDKDQFSDKCE